jgi:hypothetical protein
MTFVTPRPGIVGGQEARRAIATTEFADVGSTGQTVVARIIRIGAEIDVLNLVLSLRCNAPEAAFLMQGSEVSEAL